MKPAVALQRISNQYKQGRHAESSIRNNKASRGPPMNLYKYISLIVCYLNPCSAAPGCTRIAETHPTAAHGYTRE